MVAVRPAVDIRPLTPAEVAQRRRRSVAIAVVLAVLVVVFFITTIVRLSSHVAGG
jgi:hypothetical protein